MQFEKHEQIAMAQNRVAPDRPTKQSNRFFTKPRSRFNPNIKKIQKKQKNSEYNFQNKSQYSSELGTFRPSTSGFDNFFVKPNNNAELSNVSHKPDINSQRQSTSTMKSDKKPFDKKKYRLKKYSKKYKLELWEDKRKKAVLRNYYQSIKQDEPTLDVKNIYDDPRNEIIDSDNGENENNLDADINRESISNEDIHQKEIAHLTNSKGKKNKAFRKAHVEFQNIKEQKNKEKEEKLRKKLEKEEALQTYKQKKLERFKKLNRKTKRGQPIMKDRIEMLLEKIQNNI